MVSFANFAKTEFSEVGIALLCRDRPTTNGRTYLGSYAGSARSSNPLRENRPKAGITGSASPLSNAPRRRCRKTLRRHRTVSQLSQFGGVPTFAGCDRVQIAQANFTIKVHNPGPTQGPNCTSPGIHPEVALKNHL